MIRNVSDKVGGTYEERLESVGLTTLVERRERGDMIETFKTVNGFNKVDKDEWFKFRSSSNTRATRSTVVMSEGEQRDRDNVIFVENVRLESRKNFFTVRVANGWNRIPENVKNQKSINAFKNSYDNWRKSEKQKEQQQQQT